MDINNARTLIRSDVHKMFGYEWESQNDLKLACDLDSAIGSLSN